MSEIILPEVELNIHTPKNPTEAVVVENYVCTAESSPNIVRHITLDLTGTELDGHFRTGQSIGVLAPGEDHRGKPHKVRLYSLSSPTKGEGGNQHLVSTTVKRANEEVDGTFYTGVCSNYICNLKVGDKVKVTGPSGKRFLLPENVDDFNFVFFATGTGIAPFRGMILELLESGFKGQVVLVFGCPYRTDVLYPELFDRLEEEHENFHFVKMISREDRRPDGSKYYVQTAIEDRADLLDPILGSDNSLIYLCGMKGMETGIYHNLAKKGFMGYLRLKGQPSTEDPNEWGWKEAKELLKPSDRTFEEVY